MAYDVYSSICVESTSDKRTKPYCHNFSNKPGTLKRTSFAHFYSCTRCECKLFLLFIHSCIVIMRINAGQMRCTGPLLHTHTHTDNIIQFVSDCKTLTYGYKILSARALVNLNLKRCADGTDAADATDVQLLLLLMKMMTMSTRSQEKSIATHRPR